MPLQIPYKTTSTGPSLHNSQQMTTTNLNQILAHLTSY